MSNEILNYDKVAEASLAKAQRDGAETMWDRRAAQKTQCGFGEAGVCCRICAMGPCRVSPVPGKGAERGICGANADTIVARNFARMVAGGTSAHSDHARDIVHAMHGAKAEGPFKIRDEAKLRRIAGEWGIEAADTKETYALAHELADMALQEFGKPFGTQRFLKRAPIARQELWERERIAPRAIDMEVTTLMHSTHMGCASDYESLFRRGMRTGLSDGWGGSMIGTEFSDIMYGTPSARPSSSNLGVIDAEMVNVLIHGHDPNLAEMVVLAAQNPEMVELAKAKGAKGINIVGMCCTGNEMTMRHGIKIAGNFYQQEMCIITGAIEAVVVDVQCIFPALPALAKTYHTRFISTSQKAKISGDMYIEFSEETGLENANEIIKIAVENFPNRDAAKVEIPDIKQDTMVGYSVEAIIDHLDAVVNSQLEDELGTVKPLTDVIYAGVLRGAAGVVGCNNPKQQHDYAHVKVMEELIKRDVICVVTGCAAQAAAKAGLLTLEAKDRCGRGLLEVCERVNIPPVLHMGSCVDISRILHIVNLCADVRGIDPALLPVVGIAPEWMSEKAVSIANYVVGSGINTYLGVIPQVLGSPNFTKLLTEDCQEFIGAHFVFEKDPIVMVDKIMEDMEEKRTALGI
ncbi:anaerobic carbon-monoxide dehydrogenase catalytic subunit [Acetobacterium woodii]|uniref:Carbon monoxide dehydrogenase n=1 Tax=Acetobacterium woodii (strain ATCC 29683 / DSM 1030 / JCM 2381 / KCTC 1655 / WB1) TaxID=931626 RepID=H6LD21_ACEWD|nr:anaerobic carbon-monoxide dehydrogenase catalytic subunit [Acetobacterium woodii]AFA47860.1 CO dehydrogenase, catalytic subunit AcsA [Acetobacterium woodii DSM 1030]